MLHDAVHGSSDARRRKRVNLNSTDGAVVGVRLAFICTLRIDWIDFWGPLYLISWSHKLPSLILLDELYVLASLQLQVPFSENEGE
jgi:hypothetical protein